MTAKSKKNSLGGVLTLLAFALFVVALMSVLLTGADAVGRLTERDRDSYDRRTAAQYIATRVRQADREGVLRTGEYGGTDALFVVEEIDGCRYHTVVYCWGGYLRELYCEEGLDLDPEFGEVLLPLDGLSAENLGSCIQVTLTKDDRTDVLRFLLRSGGETE